MEFQQNQRSELREHFRNHIYYKLCRAVHRVFLQHTPSIIMNAEVLFVDAVKTLDILLTEGDFEAERCADLWSDTLSDYREKDGARADMATTQAEVAMLFYAVNYGLLSVNHSHYRKTLALTLHQSIHEMWNCNEKKNCDFVESNLQEIKTLSNDMYEWMDTYFSSTESLTDEIENIINPNKVNQIAKTGLPLPNALNTQNAQKYFLEAINRGWMELEDKKFIWKGIGKSAHSSQLAYFCGRVYGYEHSLNGNIGTEFPNRELEELFGVKNLYSSLRQVYSAQKNQKWRTCIDELFK